MEQQPARTLVSEEEMRLAFSAPAVFTNRFFVTVQNGSVRISFCEQEPATGVLMPRTSLYMQGQDAIALRRLLEDMLKPLEEFLEKSAQQQET